MEKDLFLPIKEYFESQGYVCDGEVKEIDLYMERDGEGAAVELKQDIDFRAVQQAALRQKLVETVYIGTFMPKDIRSHAYRDKLYLLKRLGIGLIAVSEKTGNVKVLNEPVVAELSAFQRRNKKKTRQLKKEFHRRKVKNNIGGVRGTKLVTGYREDALLVLDALLEIGGEGAPKKVADVSGIHKAREILYANYYGWFEPVTRGVYRATQAGYDALEEFEETVFVLKKAQEKTAKEKAAKEQIEKEKAE